MFFARGKPSQRSTLLSFCSASVCRDGWQVVTRVAVLALAAAVGPTTAFRRRLARTGTVRPAGGYVHALLAWSEAREAALPGDEAAPPLDFQSHDAPPGLDEGVLENYAVPAAEGTSAEHVEAVYIKEVANDLIVCELYGLRRIRPDLFEVCIAQRGCVEIVLQMDGPSVRRFSDEVVKLEQGVLKLLLPGIASPQQTPFWSIPFFLMQGARPSAPAPDEPTTRPLGAAAGGRRVVRAGPETYTLIRQLLFKMKADANVPKAVQVRDAGPDDLPLRLQAEWSFCGDLAVTDVTGGMGGIRVARPCPVCNWERGHKEAVSTAERNFSAVQHCWECRVSKSRYVTRSPRACRSCLLAKP